MKVPETDGRTRRRHTGSAEGDGEPQEDSNRRILSVGSREWSVSTSVTASPVVEHLALAAGDALVAICNLCLLVLLRPPWFQEASDNVRSDVIERPKPSILYVAVLAVACGLGGIFMKALVISWCLSQRTSNDSCMGLSTYWGQLLRTEFLGGYCISPRVVSNLFCSWVFVTAALFQLMGAPLDAIPSSILLGVFFATVGFLGPYASAVVEGCRSARWVATERHPRGSRRAQPDGAANPAHVLPVVTSTGVGPRWLGSAVAVVRGSLRCLDLLCFPLVFASHAFNARHRRAGSVATILHPQEIGNLLVLLSILPLVICCTLCLISCILLPMDWPTVYIVYPSPLLMSVSLGYPLACSLCFVILLLLPIFYSFPSRYARATPVLQELLLKPAEALPTKSAREEGMVAQ